MSLPTPTPHQITTAYRHLFKSALRAVQYSQPARFIVQRRLRNAFRQQDSAFRFDAAKIARTLEFLDGAARVKGLEHRILKNLMHVWWEQARLGRMMVRLDVRPFQARAYVEFDETVERLNESMGLCIR